MLRQLRDAVRFAIADFFDVPWQGILTMLAFIAAIGIYGYLRLFYFGAWGLRFAVLAVVAVLAYAGTGYIRRR